MIQILQETENSFKDRLTKSYLEILTRVLKRLHILCMRRNRKSNESGPEKCSIVKSYKRWARAEKISFQIIQDLRIDHAKAKQLFSRLDTSKVSAVSDDSDENDLAFIIFAFPACFTGNHFTRP